MRQPAIWALVLVAVVTPVAAATDEPGGTATITPGPDSSTGTGTARVDWQASCPNPGGGTGHFWSVAINAYHQDGSHASYVSTAESGVTSDARTQSVGLHVAPGLDSETFTVIVTLSCSPNPVVTIGEAAVTVGHGGGSGGGGNGNGGGGNGGGGSGGGTGGGASGGTDPSDPLRPGGCARELRGTAGPDILDAGPDDDLVLGFGGDDQLRGGEGDDCLVGAGGSDRLLGDAGYDRLTGGTGDDRLDGGSGRNAYDAGPGSDRVEARNGHAETVRCGPGVDTAYADESDRLRGCEHVRTRAARP
jgi:Ca2+-binding RTX toxin-like protein